MLGYFFQFLGMICFGIANCLWIFPLKEMSNTRIIIYRSLITSTLFGILFYLTTIFNLPFIGKAKDDIELKHLIYSVLICAFSYFGLYFYSLSLKYTKVSIAVPIASMGALFGIVTGILVYNEIFTLQQTGCGFVFLIGLFILNDQTSSKSKFNKGLIFNLLAAFFWGTSFALFRMCVLWLGAPLFSFILEITVFAMSLLTFFFNENDIKSLKLIPYSKNSLLIVLILAGLVFNGVLFNNLAVYLLPVSHMSLLGICSEVISIFFAFIILKEKISIKQYIGISIILSGLIILQF